MKKLIFFILLLATAQLFAQPWKSIKGDGQLKKETRALSEFSSISSRGSIEVKITKGQPGKIEVEADENLLPYIETNVENGKLIIQTKKNINIKSASKMVVYVNMTLIKSLQVSGSGNIDANGIFKGDDASEFIVSGSGNIHFSSASFKNVSFSISGSGNITAKGGSADDLSVSVRGSGNVYVSDISAENVEAKISGSGNTKVSASKSLSANISGSGNIFYQGNATDISSKVNGSGKLIKG
ncbi:MAG: head GIN domain-containing protein [Ginsengibacter sp.]